MDLSYLLLLWGMWLLLPWDKVHWMTDPSRYQLPAWMNQSCYALSTLAQGLVKSEVIRANVLQGRWTSASQSFPNRGTVNSATLQNPKNPKQHTAHTITWSDFRLEAPNDRTNCKPFRMTGVIGRCGFSWVLPSLARIFTHPWGHTQGEEMRLLDSWLSACIHG